jgi:predicted CopG family antitoxin
MDKKANIEKVKEQLDKDVVNELLKMKKVGESYSDVIRRLLKARRVKA